METKSATVVPRACFESNSLVDESAIHHMVTPSEDFTHISIQANAAAADLMRTMVVSSEPKRLWGESIGILDLEEEGASFQVESKSEEDFLKMFLDSIPETQIQNWDPWRSKKLASTSHDSSQVNDSFGSLDPKHLASESLREQKAGSNRRSPTSPGSFDIAALSLELQTALKVAELEVSQLRAQVSSKTQHLELAQRALVEYEDEVHSLRNQLTEITNSSWGEGMNAWQSHERKVSQENFVKDLWRVKSGTHRIRQSLGESGDDSFLFKNHHLEEMKENCDRLNARNEELEKGNANLKIELEIVSDKLQKALVQAEEHDEKLGTLIDENRFLVKEKTKLKTQLIQAQEELMCVLTDVPDADEEVTTYRRRLKESQEQRDKLHRDLDCIKAELAALKSEKANWFSIDDETLIDDERDAEQENEDRVLHLKEKLNSKLQELPEMLDPDDATSNDGPEILHDQKEHILQLQEALSLALEAKALLEERLEAKNDISPDGLASILDDISMMKDNYQRERKMALRERTENENTILYLQQEKEILLHQMENVTEGLSRLQNESLDLQKELANKHRLAEDFRIHSENRIRELELENASIQRKMAQVREALDLCLEAKRELELRVHQSDFIVSDWMRSVDQDRMREEENFTALLRRRIESGNLAHMKQAALQAVEHLERLQEEAQKRMDWSSTSADLQYESPRTVSESGSDSSRMMTVTSQQLRMLRRDLRDATAQRDEALNLLNGQKANDARRFSEIKELQTELNAALDQYEQLLPKFHEVLNAKREMENKIQQLIQDVDQKEQQRKELEREIFELLTCCQQLTNGEGPSKPRPVLEAIASTKAEIVEFCKSANKHPTTSKSSLIRFTDKTPNRGFPSGSQQCTDMRPFVDHLKSMVDKERDLHRYLDCQTEKLSKMKVDTEKRSHWIRRTASHRSMVKDNCPVTEMQIQEHDLTLGKLHQRDSEISELMEQLEKSKSSDLELQSLLQGWEATGPTGSFHPFMAQGLGERLNRLQECAGSLEEQLIAVKNENKELKAERQALLQKLRS